MKKFMQYEVAIAAVPEDVDASRQELAVFVDDVTMLAESCGVEGGVFNFEALVDSAVRVELFRRDNAGNPSQEAATVEFTAVDEIGPPTPGADAIAVQCVGERLEGDEEPEPEPEA